MYIVTLLLLLTNVFMHHRVTGLLFFSKISSKPPGFPAIILLYHHDHHHAIYHGELEYHKVRHHCRKFLYEQNARRSYIFMMTMLSYYSGRQIYSFKKGAFNDGVYS